jgi:hypothetical protein
MDPDVFTPNIHTVQTTSVTAVDDHVVDLSVLARVHGEMKLRRVNQCDIVDCKIRNL